ncbi:MAG: hypothetical protein KBS95_04930 [Alistipes sp.]|nr:hypothetical protein [Candidatus Alistipes equi]
MKRIVILILFAFALSENAFAQPTLAQKMIHRAAIIIADKIGVGESDKETFMSMYQSYRKERLDIMRIHPQAMDDIEKATEAKILSDFEKSDKLLQLRKLYYTKFRTFLSPTQIQKMYDAEKNAESNR